MSLNDENSKTVYQELFVVTGFLIVERMFYLPSYDQVFTMLQCFLCETSEQLGPATQNPRFPPLLGSHISLSISL